MGISEYFWSTKFNNSWSFNSSKILITRLQYKLCKYLLKTEGSIPAISSIITTNYYCTISSIITVPIIIVQFPPLLLYQLLLYNFLHYYCTNYYCTISSIITVPIIIVQFPPLLLYQLLLLLNLFWSVICMKYLQQDVKQPAINGSIN